MSLNDTLNALKTAIIGTKTSTIDAKLDKAVKDISSYKSQSGRNGYIDLVKSVISQSTSNNITLDNQGGLFNQGISNPSSFGHGERLYRYKMFEGIVTNISYCYRALNVLTDNILSPDDITKTTLEIGPNTYLEDAIPTESKVTYVKEIVKRLKLEYHMPDIVKSTLKYGDYFCEIADAKTALTSKSMLMEGFRRITEQDRQEGRKEKLLVEQDKKQGGNIELLMDYSSYVDTKDDDQIDAITTPDKEKEENLKNLDTKNLAKYSLIFHSPDRVIRLQSDLFPVCFGYLIFPNTTISPQLQMQDQAVNAVCSKILNSLEKKIPDITNTTNSKEIKSLIKVMIDESDPNKLLSVRYIAPDRIQHFRVSSTKYQPYGESIFESSQFSAKMLIALETALTIHRLSRSTEKRKISVELGLPRDAKKMIEKLKEEMRKRKISLDSFGSVDTIPSMISTFEDVYIPTKDGKAFVDISTFNEGGVDIRGKVDELKFMRDQVVASLGVPPSFISIEEGLCCDIYTKIPLLSGETITLKEIIRNFEYGKDMWIYSYDHSTGKIAPGKILWAGVTKKQTKIIRIHLDNKKYIDCTPEHPFMLRDGTYIEAQKLKENDSLMPLYRKQSNSYTAMGYTYEYIYNPGLDSWQLTHRCVSENLGIVKQGDGKDVHHLNFNCNDNDPCNLKGLYKHQHIKIHGENTKFHRENRVTIIKQCEICKNDYEIRSGINQVTCSPECSKEVKRINGRKSYELRKKENGNKLRPDLICVLCDKPTKWTKIELTNKRYEQIKSKCISCEDPKCKSKIRAYSNITKQGTKLYCNIEFVNCEVCNSIIIQSEDKKNVLQACNIKCRNTILARRGAEKKKNEASIELICPVCDDTFNEPKWVSKSVKYGHTCGKEECKIVHNYNTQKEKNKHNYTLTKCVVCNEEFEIIKGYLKQIHNPCCSKIECKQILNSTIKNTRGREKVLNHKVVRVEVLEGLHDTGDITVENHHNFAVDAGVIIHNSNKNALSEENILFARTIVSHQKYFTQQTQDLIRKICEMINPEEAFDILDNVSIALAPPKSLQFEREAKYMGDLATLVETLERIGIPKEWAKRKYLTNIDWDELEKYEIGEKIEKTMGTEPKEDDSMGGGGFGGGMSGGF